MPGLLAPLLGVALGALLGFAPGLHPDPDEPAREARGARVVALFALLVFAPACAYFLVFAGDWSYAYLVDARRVPSAIELVLVAADGAAVVAGFVLARRRLAARAFGAAIALVAAPLGVALVAALVLAPRLAVEGTYAQFHGDYGTRPLVGGPVGIAVVWMGAVVAIGAFVAARALRFAAPSRRGRSHAPAPEAPKRLLGVRGATARDRGPFAAERARSD